MKHLLSAILLLSASVAFAGSADDAQSAISAAEAAYAKVDAVGNAWTTSSAFIKKAKEALSKGDADTALALANRSTRESEAAFAQYQREQTAWQMQVIR